MSPRLSAIHLYPVKSLGGIAVADAVVTPRGLARDRRYMVVDPQGGFLTQRECPQMATLWTDIGRDGITISAADIGELTIPLDPPNGETMRVWRGRVEASLVSPEADSFLHEALGIPCRLVGMPDDCIRPVNPALARPGDMVNFADNLPVLLASAASLDDLNARIAARGGTGVPMSRFRPNLIVEGLAPFAEDGWTRLRIGKAVFRSAAPCIRCEMTTIDQATGEVRGPEPLATLTTFRDSDAGVRFGQNLIPETAGTIRLGDPVELLA